jgi:hypothetical protein
VTTSEATSDGSEGKLSPVVACTLSSEDRRVQVERWRRLKREAGLACSETENGLWLRFRDERAVEEELRALVALERRCCAWAGWEIRRDDGQLALHVSSTGAGVAALKMMFSAGRDAAGPRSAPQ